MSFLYQVDATSTKCFHHLIIDKLSLTSRDSRHKPLKILEFSFWFCGHFFYSNTYNFTILLPTLNFSLAWKSATNDQYFIIVLLNQAKYGFSLFNKEGTKLHNVNYPSYKTGAINSIPKSPVPFSASFTIKNTVYFRAIKEKLAER